MEKEEGNACALDVIREVDIEQIIVNPHQPRSYFSQVELEELSQSIIQVGLLHPPLVRALPCEKMSERKMYEIISGERRFRAAGLAGLKRLQVVIRDTSEKTSAQAALIENIQRVDLNPLEIAKALQRLIQSFQFTQEALATQIGKKRSSVANYLRLLSLPENIQEAIANGVMTMGHAKAILTLDGQSKQNLLFEMIMRDQLNVREAEKVALKISKKEKRKKLIYVDRDFYLEELASKLQQKLGTKVTIQGNGKKGKILINYYSLDDLDRVMDAVLEKS